MTPEGRVVLVDFGASKQGIGSDSTQSFTLAYAPLEVISGTEVGPSSDIFSLGVMLYEMLTGERPPDALKRFSTNLWQPIELEQPWQNLVSQALNVQKEERPKDLKSWWNNAFNYSTVTNSIYSTQNELETLDRISTQVKSIRDLQAETIANSFREYILNLRKTFKIYFWDERPKLSFLYYLLPHKRKEFEAQLTADFASYLDVKISEWILKSDRQIHSSLDRLDRSLTSYGIDREGVRNEKLSKEIIPQLSTQIEKPRYPRSKKILIINYLLAIAVLSLGNIAVLILVVSGLNWQNIIFNLIGSIVLGGILLGGIGGILFVSLIVGAIQIELARKQFLKTTNQKMLNSLLRIAKERQEIVYKSVENIFERYEREIRLKVSNIYYI